ncbi:MAG: ATP-binding protein [Pseudobutyrivibrio sp.]|nr:ATP-binding protein [Pseudobutyrivibrio sp.]
MLAWEYVWEIFVNMIESFLFLIFMEDHLGSKIFKSYRYTTLIKIVFIIIDSIITDYTNFINLNAAYRVSIGLFTFVFFAFIFYNNSPFKKILFPCIFTLFLLISDTTAMLISSIFLDGNIETMKMGGLLRIPTTSIYILTIIIFIFIMHVFQKNPCLLQARKYIYLFYCLIGFSSCYYISAITIQSFYLFHNFKFTKNMIFISSFFSVIFILLLAYIYNLSCEREKNQKLLEERRQLIFEEAEYKNLLELTSSLRQFKHDVQHHLNALEYISRNGSQSELEEYITNFNGEIEETHKFISSGNMTIDSILSSKIPAAEAKGIKVTYALSIPNAFSLNPVNIATILGNLWNNSIEACEQLKFSNNKSLIPSIDFYIKPIQNMLLISIENTFNGIVFTRSDGTYLSTKKDGIYHGFGLQRVIKITKENDGFIDITSDNNKFCVHIMFPLEREPSL